MRKRRSGFTVLELTISCSMLLVLMSLTIVFLGTAGRQGRVLDSHELGLWEASNQLERLSALPYAERTPAKLATLSPSSEAQRLLPLCRVTAKLDGTDLENFQRLTVTIQWRNRTADEKVSLATWVRSGSQNK